MTDERQRLLERSFSREGASEAVEEHVDPSTGETVQMTPSQWALAEYDRRHAAPAEHGSAIGRSGRRSSDAGRAERPAGVDAAGPSADDPGADDVRADDRGADDRAAAREHPARAIRRAVPYLAALAGLLIGVAIGVGIGAALGSSRFDESTAGRHDVPMSPASVPPAALGEGDEGATLAAVTNYFDSTSGVHDLPAEVTSGFDAGSFRAVGRREMGGRETVGKSSAVYAARRLDGSYCLIAVAEGRRAAETCGTMDDIARRGLTLSTDAVDGMAVTVTVTWQTDGTISWTALPAVG